MKGSIRFNKDINIEVDVDPAAEEGARLISAKNLVDGQEAGGGGGDGLYKSAIVTFDFTEGGTPVTDIWSVSFGYIIYFGDHIDEFNEFDATIRRNHQTTPAVVELPIIENQPCYMTLSNFEGVTNNEAEFFYDLEGQGVTVEGGAEIVDLANGVINITGDCIIHLPVLWD